MSIEHSASRRLFKWHTTINRDKHLSNYNCPPQLVVPLQEQASPLSHSKPTRQIYTLQVNSAQKYTQASSHAAYLSFQSLTKCGPHNRSSSFLSQQISVLLFLSFSLSSLFFIVSVTKSKRKDESVTLCSAVSVVEFGWNQKRHCWEHLKDSCMNSNSMKSTVLCQYQYPARQHPSYSPWIPNVLSLPTQAPPWGKGMGPNNTDLHNNLHSKYQPQNPPCLHSLAIIQQFSITNQTDHPVHHYMNTRDFSRYPNVQPSLEFWRKC